MDPAAFAPNDAEEASEGEEGSGRRFFCFPGLTPGLGVDRLPDASLAITDEHREGYDRDLSKHWVDEDRDGCSTRAEVLIAEAVQAPTVGPGCKISGGGWLSYYDENSVEDVRSLDIDHMVPLAEAWDSGASKWTAKKRER